MAEIEAEVEPECTPGDVREGVRSGILDSIRRDVELRGERTFRLLLAAGVSGVVGALGATLLISKHPFGHHPGWHVAVFSAVWAGLLVVSFAIALLRVRTPSLPLARAVTVGILGFGIAGVCGALCPEPHFLAWWSGTGIGAPLTTVGGPALGALCFGLMTTLVFGAASAFLLLGNPQQPRLKPVLPAAILFVLLVPGVALQSVDTSLGVFAGWVAGTAVGALLGVASGDRARSLLFGS